MNERHGAFSFQLVVVRWEELGQVSHAFRVAASGHHLRILLEGHCNFGPGRGVYMPLQHIGLLSLSYGADAGE
jgi:hypothetical protein